MQRVVETAPVGQAGQTVARGQLFQRHLRMLFLGHVAQRLDHRAEAPVLVENGTGIGCQIALAPRAGHVAPAFGRQVGAGRAGVVTGVQLRQFAA